jgi:hypothetical protein
VIPDGASPNSALVSVEVNSPSRFVASLKFFAPRGSSITLSSGTGGALVGGSAMLPTDTHEGWSDNAVTLVKGDTTVYFLVTPVQQASFTVEVHIDADEIQRVKVSKEIDFP